MRHPFLPWLVTATSILLALPSVMDAQDHATDKDDIAELRRLADRVVLDRAGDVVEVWVAMRSPSLEIDDVLNHIDIDKLHRIRKLAVSSASDDAMKRISELLEPEELMIYSSRLTDLGVAAIGEMKSLKALHLNALKVTEEGLTNLGRLENLRSLSLFTLQASDDTMWHLSQCKQLENLQLVEPNISNVGLEHLSTIHTLKKLDLCSVYRMGGYFSGPDREFSWGTKITDDGLEFVSRLSKLEFLALTNTRVGSGLSHLENLENLKTLILDKTDVSDADLDHVLKLQSLEFLSLTETAVTDAGVVPLREMPNLHRLWLFRTKVTNFAGLRESISDVRGDNRR